MNQLPALLHETFPPSEDALWNGMRPKVDDAMLREIAEADYGHQADEMFDVLRKLRDKDEWPVPIDRQLIEVLQLIRWSDPDHPNKPPFAPGPAGIDGHLTRLWACTALLRAEDLPEIDYRYDDYGSTIAQAIGSASHFDPSINVPLAQYLAWRLSQPEGTEPRLLNILGMLVLVLRLVSKQQRDLLAQWLIEWLEEIDAKQAHDLGPLDASDPRPGDFSMTSGFWKPIVDEARAGIEELGSTELQERWAIGLLLFVP